MRTNNRRASGSRSRSAPSPDTEWQAQVRRGRRAEALASARARRARRVRVSAGASVLAAIVVAAVATATFALVHERHAHPRVSGNRASTPTRPSPPRSSSHPAALANGAPAATANCSHVISPPSSIAAAEAAANPGDVLCLHGGVYNQLVSLTKSGTPTAALTVMSVPGERAVIDGTNLHPVDALLELRASYVLLRGLTVQNSNKFGIANYGHHDTVQAGLIAATQQSGIVTTGRGGGENDHNWYDHDEVTRTVLSNTNDALGGGGWDSAIDNIDGSGASGNNLYTGNVVHDNWGEGQKPADGDTLRANTYFDNWSAEVLVDGTQNATIEKNLMYTTYRTRPTSPRRLGTGIGLADETGPARSASNVIRNNIIENVGTGMSYWNAGTAGTGLKRDQIDDNTVVNTWNCGICFDAGAHTGTLLRDNLVVPRSGTVAAGTTAPGIAATANLFTTRGAAADPRLAGEGTFSFDPGDYRLTDKSASAIDHGVPTSAADDYMGTARPQHARDDIGAFERR